MKGGKVLGSGTYGCILKPAVPCLGSTKRPPDTVSKLMMNYNALDEMQEIINISKITKKIPDHNQYYILNQIRICPPENLTTEDKIDFNRKCTAMTNKGIKENKINEAIDQKQIGILQLPDGGFDIAHYFGEGNINVTTFKKINEALLKLLVGGIRPLYKAGVLHFDLKGPNIVYSKSNGLARVIDWGLSIIIRGNKVPEKVSGWPIMFNSSFGILALHKSIQTLYNSLILAKPVQNVIIKNKHSDLVSALHPLIKDAFLQIILNSDHSIVRYVGSLGHIEYINGVLRNIIELSPPSITQDFVDRVKKSPFRALTNMVSDHLAKIFLTFSVNSDGTIGNFREKEYFDSVFKHNCDIIGFISCYYDLISNKNTDADRRYKAYNIINKFQFSVEYATQPIDIKEVVTLISESYLPDTIVEVKKNQLPLEPSRDTDIPKKKNNFSWTLKKRCPNGYRRNKETKKCVKKIDKSKTKRRRCPNGTRINKKTGLCEPK